MQRHFYDYLKEHLHRAGLYDWARDKTVREAIEKPEFLKAVERAWEEYQDATSRTTGA